MNQKLNLNTGWEFRLSSNGKDDFTPDNKNLSEKWLQATVPGTIHTDLMNNNIIPDPFYSDNEIKLRWIDQLDWEYRTSFNLDNAEFDFLVFDGIDTIADIYLNDSLLFKAENMFIKYRLDITGKITKGTNTLKIVFKSAKIAGRELEDKYGKLPVELESHRVYLRKAQYSFGWDWGPAFPTVGIWKSVYLERSPKCAISNVKFVTKKIENNIAHLELSYDLQGELENVNQVVIQIDNQVYNYKEKVENYSALNNIHAIQIENPELWYPSGSGEQNLYKLKIYVEDNSENIIDEYSKSVGIRTVELQLENDKAQTFRFIINGKPLFIKGVNWIPADSFLPRIDDGKYERLLTLSKEAHVNMVRVWGGGIYENDIFYETCDKLGLLVWQDFMFACAAYPEYDQFIENVKDEIHYQVTRLRNHPSLAIWCGNNENEWIWFMKHSARLKEMPGYNIYHEIIPEILKSTDSSRPYWASSPFGFDEDPNSFDSGNTHQWMIWSNWIDYEEVVEDRSLFVTEFGFQGPANIDTFNNVIPEENRHIQSDIFKHHNKQVEGPERVNKFLENHLPVTEGWEDYIYLTQLNQGFALKTCLEHWRTNGRTSGSIIWQINDCWPVTSWAIVDSELYPKLAYHFVKNIFSPQLIYFSKNNNEIEILTQNQNSENYIGSCKIFFIDARSGSIEDQMFIEFNAGSNAVKKIGSFPLTDPGNDKRIIYAELYNEFGEIISTNYYKLHPWKFYKTAVPGITLKLTDESDSIRIILTSDKPAYFVDLYAEGIRFSKRGFTIMPDEEVKVDVLNKNPGNFNIDNIKIYSLNNFLK